MILLYASDNREWLFHEPTGNGREYEDIKIVCRDNTLTINGGAPDNWVVLVKYAGQPVCRPAGEMCVCSVAADALVAHRDQNRFVIPPAR